MSCISQRAVWQASHPSGHTKKTHTLPADSESIGARVGNWAHIFRLQKCFHYPHPPNCKRTHLLWLAFFRVSFQHLIYGTISLCLQYVLARWLCFCLFERYHRSLNLKQKAEPAVWTARNLFLCRLTKPVINTDKSSCKEILGVRERPFSPFELTTERPEETTVCAYVSTERGEGKTVQSAKFLCQFSHNESDDASCRHLWRWRMPIYEGELFEHQPGLWRERCQTNKTTRNKIWGKVLQLTRFIPSAQTWDSPCLIMRPNFSSR